MVRLLSPDARRIVLESAAEEARRRGDRCIGTDHLLLGLLHDRHSAAARALGVDLGSARAASATLDGAALAAIGVDVGDLTPMPPSFGGRRRPPLSSGARAVLKAGIDEARSAKARSIGTRELLLALLARRRPDPAAELFAALGVDPDEARDRLARSG
jgi:ATP-dependent Clp protease ATP-binding subunit ClpA